MSGLILKGRDGRWWRVLAAVALVATGVVLAQAGRASADGSLLFSGWSPLGGVAQGAPATTTWGGSRSDLFVRGSDNNLWHTWHTGSWSAWEDLGAPPGGLASDPGAVAWSAGRVDVFVAGADGQLWHKFYAGSWSAWEDLGGGVVGAPAVSSWAAGRLDVFVRGTDNRLWHKWYSGAWSPWQPLGGALTSSPAAVSWGPGRIDVFVRGSDMAAWQIAYAGGWSGFGSLGGVFAYSPGVTSWGSGRLDLFATGSDNRLYHQWYDGGPNWSGWQLAQSGTLTSGPAAVSPAVGDVEVFGRGTNLGIWEASGALPAVQCSFSAITPYLGGPEEAAGHLYFSVYFINVSSTACYLYGFPGVSYVDSSGNQIGVPAGEMGGYNYGPVALVPYGTSAEAVLELTDVGVYPTAKCQPANPAGIRIYPPGSTASTIVPFQGFSVCSNPAFSGWSYVSDVFGPAQTPD